MVVPQPALPSWWLDEALAAEGEGPEALSLATDLDVDVAIVGGGYTGLWTALALSERDARIRVAVLEAEIVGWGPSGRNGGFVGGYYGGLGQLQRLFGTYGALAVGRAGARIVPAIREFCERRAEDVWLREDGYLKLSCAPTQDAGIDAVLEAARSLGIEDDLVQPLSPAEVQERCRSPRFRHGVLVRDTATVQPARLARALRRAVLDEGVPLYERTPVLHVTAGSPNILETTGGRVRAEHVVLATSAALAGWRPVAGRLTNFGSYVVLTEPVPELLAEIGWVGGEAICDGRMFLHYFRTTNDGRVLMGSGSGPIGSGGRIDVRFSGDVPTAGRAARGLRRLLPAFAEVALERSWGGAIDVSADHVPFFGTAPGTRIHYGAGYSGHGAGPSWIGGQVLASLVTGAQDEWTGLPLVNRSLRSLPPEPFRQLGGSAVRAAILACEEAEEEGRRGSLPARAVADLPRLLGMQLGTR
ncbi:MAG TPA: FAD-binding oxidoreductase [Gaiellaceae bacterium]|nr:FAD-binding oxidoreductase [Gaiellaceae bacterium]